MSDENALREELELFEQHRKEWVRSNPGKYVVVIGNNVVGFYQDYRTAFIAGLSAAGLGRSFLLKQVLARDPVYFIF